ncbi:MAG TPA: hypothetical protein VFR27_13675 [Mycobacterium sp.]|nr:hypothetical protein [Mycobacterium sp.]
MGYLAFNLPRTVRVVLAGPGIPVYFAVYRAALTVACLVAIAAIVVRPGPALSGCTPRR